MRLPRGDEVFRSDPLLKAGVVIMAFAVALTVVAVVVVVVSREEPEQAGASETAANSSVKPLVRSGPPGEASAEETQANSEPEPEPQAMLQPEGKPKPESQQEPLPAAEGEWQEPTQQEIEAASRPRHYTLPPGAIMGLTVPALEIYNVPVFDSDAPLALAEGVGHVPETSLPWSSTPQRNVYIAGHRMGYRGTWSRMVFYHLGRLGEGDEVILKDRNGEVYRYRVSEVFLAEPAESWVMGQLRDRDIVTLQTCTPIPTFEKRLIVRADRV
jgi:sortase A